MISIVPYQSTAVEAWDSCVSDARNGFFIFQRAYMDYHQDRFRDHSLMFVKNGQPPIAVLPANRAGDSLVTHGGLTFGGLLASARCRLGEIQEMFARVVDHMRSNGLKRLVYRTIPHIYQQSPGDEDVYALEQLGARVCDTKVSCAMKIGCGPGFRASRRREVTRARNAEVVVSQSDEIAPFMGVLNECLTDRYATTPVHSLEEMSLLHARFPENIQAWTAKINGRIAAGLMLYRDCPCTRVQYAASTAEGRACSALDLIYHHIIRNVLSAGSWLDLGASMRPGDGLLNESLMFYKESLGSRTLLYRTYVLDID